ncbi:uncharacterized protein LOC127131865 [Lathyrus oleraceus]|uniref:uncharacterized protein LOC127131865 n=1 Tax=Pisum sativum TaxID=3888 RepID=UPI0021CEBFAA|nr:uncharacterized protein LOC127131865 [Pisum sativum]
MSYEKLYPALIQKNLVQTRTPTAIPKELPWWYKSHHHCAFHQGSPGHDIENCLTLKAGVKRLVQNGILSFEDSGPNVQANLLPKHGGATVNMVEGCPGKDRDEDEHDVNVIVPHFNIPEPVVIAYNSQKFVVSPLVIRLAGSTPYESDRVVPYKYNAIMLEDGKEVPIIFLSYVVNVVDVSGVTRSGRVFAFVPPKRIEDTSVGKQAQVETPVVQSGQSNGVNQKYDHDERLCRKSWSNYVDYDVTIGQFDDIGAKITACNNLSFSDEEFSEQGRNHNLASHILMNYQEDALSNVLVDTGCSLNVMPKSNMSNLSYQGAPMRFSGVVVKAFDGSRKTMIGEVDLLLKMGLCSFHITFQVMDIHPAYSCLLGRPWIHEVGAVT